MKLVQGQHFAGELLQKNPRIRAEIWGVAGLFLLLQLFEFLLAFLFLQLCRQDAETLIDGTSKLWQISHFVFVMLRDFAKMVCGWRLWRHCSEAVQMLAENRTDTRWKMILLSVQNTLIRILFLQFVPFLLYGAYCLAKAGSTRPDHALWLFGAVQFIAAAVLCFLLWVYVCMGLWCVPFLWLSMPELPLWRVPFYAMRIMSGGRKELWRLLFWYGLQMLPVVTIPWILPNAVLAVSMFFHIRIRIFQEEKTTKKTAVSFF